MPDPEDPIAEAKRLLADKALYADNVRHLWRADVAKRAPRLLAALCERIEAVEQENRTLREGLDKALWCITGAPAGVDEAVVIATTEEQLQDTLSRAGGGADCTS